MKHRLLITGGSGFLGRHLASRLKEKYAVFLGSRNNSLNFSAENLTGCKSCPLDVTSIESVRDVLSNVRPSVVIHAAATKFVDLSEKEPFECIDVNVLGSENIARVAIEKGVDTVIGVSTDKAAPPVRNTYALSKSLMERMFCSLNSRSDTKFSCVRFGNIAWSTGSVLPIWNQMYRSSGVIKTTGPEMYRFLIDIDDACAIIEHAMINIELLQGRVVTRQMKSVKIGDMLKVWIRNIGGRYERIEERPGERVDEYLVGDIEIPYVYEHFFDDSLYYSIAFNRKNPVPVRAEFASSKSVQLSEEEILRILRKPRA